MPNNNDKAQQAEASLLKIVLTIGNDFNFYWPVPCFPVQLRHKHWTCLTDVLFQFIAYSYCHRSKIISSINNNKPTLKKRKSFTYVNSQSLLTIIQKYLHHPYIFFLRWLVNFQCPEFLPINKIIYVSLINNFSTHTIDLEYS